MGGAGAREGGRGASDAGGVPTARSRAARAQTRPGRGSLETGGEEASGPAGPPERAQHWWRPSASWGRAPVRGRDGPCAVQPPPRARAPCRGKTWKSERQKRSVAAPLSAFASFVRPLLSAASSGLPATASFEGASSTMFATTTTFSPLASIFAGRAGRANARVSFPSFKKENPVFKKKRKRVLRSSLAGPERRPARWMLA